MWWLPHDLETQSAVVSTNSSSQICNKLKISHALYVHFFLESSVASFPAVVCSRYCIAEVRRVDKFSVWRVLGAESSDHGSSGIQVCQPDEILSNYSDYSDSAFNTLAKVGKGSRTSMAASSQSLLLCFSPLTTQSTVDLCDAQVTDQPSIQLLPVKRRFNADICLPHAQSVVALCAPKVQTCALCGGSEPCKDKDGAEASCGPLVGFIRGPLASDGSILGMPTADQCWLGDGGWTRALPLDSTAAIPEAVFKDSADDDVARNIVWVHALCMNIGMLLQPDIVAHGGDCNVLSWLQGHSDKFLSMHPESRRPLALVLCGGLYCAKSYHLPDVLLRGWGKCQSHTQPGESDSNVHAVLRQLLASAGEDILKPPPACFERHSDGSLTLHGWVVAFHEPSGQHTVMLDGHPFGKPKLTALVSANHWTSTVDGHPLELGEAHSAADYRSRHLWDSADIGRNVLLFARPGDDSIQLFQNDPNSTKHVDLWAEAPIPAFHCETKEASDDGSASNSGGRRRGRSATQPPSMTLAECLSAQHSFASLKASRLGQSLYPSITDLGIPPSLAQAGSDLLARGSYASVSAHSSAKAVSRKFFDALQVDPVLALSIPWAGMKDESPLGTIRMNVLSSKLTRFVQRTASHPSALSDVTQTPALPPVCSPVPTTITLSAHALTPVDSVTSSTHAAPLPSAAVQLPSLSAVVSSACPSSAVALSGGASGLPSSSVPLPLSVVSRGPTASDVLSPVANVSRGTKRERDDSPRSLGDSARFALPASSLGSEAWAPLGIHTEDFSAAHSTKKVPLGNASADVSAFRPVAGIMVSSDMPVGLPLAVLYSSPHTVVLRRCATHSLANGITQNNPLAPPANAFVKNDAVRCMPVAGSGAAALGAALQNFAHFFGGMHGQGLMLSACMLQQGGPADRMLPVSRAIELGMPAQRGRSPPGSPRHSQPASEAEFITPPGAHMVMSIAPVSAVDNATAAVDAGSEAEDHTEGTSASDSSSVASSTASLAEGATEAAAVTAH